MSCLYQCGHTPHPQLTWWNTEYFDDINRTSDNLRSWWMPSQTQDTICRERWRRNKFHLSIKISKKPPTTSLDQPVNHLSDDPKTFQRQSSRAWFGTAWRSHLHSKPALWRNVAAWRWVKITQPKQNILMVICCTYGKLGAAGIGRNAPNGSPKCIQGISNTELLQVILNDLSIQASGKKSVTSSPANRLCGPPVITRNNLHNKNKHKVIKLKGVS